MLQHASYPELLPWRPRSRARRPRRLELPCRSTTSRASFLEQELDLLPATSPSDDLDYQAAPLLPFALPFFLSFSLVSLSLSLSPSQEADAMDALPSSRSAGLRHPHLRQLPGAPRRRIGSPPPVDRTATVVLAPLPGSAVPAPLIDLPLRLPQAAPSSAGVPAAAVVVRGQRLASASSPRTSAAAAR